MSLESCALFFRLSSPLTNTGRHISIIRLYIRALLVSSVWYKSEYFRFVVMIIGFPLLYLASMMLYTNSFTYSVFRSIPRSSITIRSNSFRLSRYFCFPSYIPCSVLMIRAKLVTRHGTPLSISSFAMHDARNVLPVPTPPNRISPFPASLKSSNLLA